VSRLSQVQKASKLMGTPVKNLQDEKLGKVENILVDLPSGRVVAVIVSSGGFLGLGDELSAVPPTALRFTPDRHTLQLVQRFIKTFTHQTAKRSNFFQRCTTGAALISAIPSRILSLSSTLDLTRICRRNVWAILPKSVSTRLSQEPCLGV
jgi:hypothetical protein